MTVDCVTIQTTDGRTKLLFRRKMAQSKTVLMISLFPSHLPIQLSLKGSWDQGTLSYWPKPKPKVSGDRTNLTLLVLILFEEDDHAVQCKNTLKIVNVSPHEKSKSAPQRNMRLPPSGSKSKVVVFISLCVGKINLWDQNIFLGVAIRSRRNTTVELNQSKEQKEQQSWDEKYLRWLTLCIY